MVRRKPSRKQKQNNSRRPFETLIILGILLFAIGSINHAQIYFASQNQPKREVFEVNAPAAISISKINLNIGILEGGIKNGEWILSDEKALFLPTSGKVGEGYNTVIYAHNTAGLFGDLKKLSQDDLIQIKDKKGREFIYKVFSIENINPKDLRKLVSREKNIVTLFTCDGWFDKERLLVRARLASPIPSTTPEQSRQKTQLQ